MTNDRFIYSSPTGNILIEATESGICSLTFTNEISCAENTDNPFIMSAISWLDIYFSKQQPDFLPALDLKGTAFQKQVWRHLSRIPYGSTETYGQLAHDIALEKGIKRMSAQAVGQAAGANPICIMIPCHRLIAANGKLGGYTGGLEHKIFLLELEGVIFRKSSLEKQSS